MRLVLTLCGLLACAGSMVSAQGVSLSGSASGGLVYDSDATGGTVSTSSEVNFLITGAGQTDGGLEFGAFIDIDEVGIDDAEVFLSGRFGTITLGGIDPATDGFGIDDIGFSGLGVDDVAEQFKNATAGADVRYSYAAGGVTIVASAEVGDETSYGVAAEYDAGALSVGVGYVDDTNDANSAFSVTAGYSFGRIAVNGLYSDWSAGSQGYGLDVSLNTGAATVTAAWAQATGTAADPEDGIGDAYGLGLSLPVSDGLTVSGGLGLIETDAVTDGSRTVADFGVTMNF
ncbi:MAG: porin [Pseudomonadota bacterium]